jgi:hypothetical protein
VRYFGNTSTFRKPIKICSKKYFSKVQKEFGQEKFEPTENGLKN